ncbi:MAG: site-specific DNA-methyltransferase [Spirochaetaceae bacterium]|jgi:adenine-specific DNA-methyltransferase|nr:site-specific DNA-methyltransferase [Spirochaetaceae bacterium]
MPINLNPADLNSFDLLDREDLVKIIKGMVTGGVTVSFHGKRSALEIQKLVRPRAIKVDKDLSYGSKEEQAKNIILEGENLQGMVTLYKYRNSIDLILTDPPYNTGKTFRYNDKWDDDPNDPELGNLVPLEDGSRHTKWMKVMLPRLQMMKAMLKSTGVLAMCIDDSEVFHLGMMLDEIFGEENRLGIINWQKTYSPKNDSTHVSSATEYVLVYAKNIEEAKTGLLGRTDEMNSSYKNPDNDPEGLWTSGDPCARTPAERDRYAIQSPFNGALHYPGTGSWRFAKKDIKAYLEMWGSKYVEKEIDDGRKKALVIDKAIIPSIPSNQNLDNNPTVIFSESKIPQSIKNAEKKAIAIQKDSVMPKLHFLKEGYGRPRIKRYLKQVKAGKVPLTFWADEDYNELFQLDCQSWEHTESGHSQTGINELDYIVGKGHNFTTVKPLKLFEKIIQLWCPPNGYILDPYAGSGTTAHAVLEINHDTGSDRKFIIIEQGSPENGDKYAKTLTSERVKRAITGERVDSDGTVKKLEEPLGGGFTFQMLTGKIDSKVIMSMKRDEMVDLIIATHWDTGKKNGINLIRIDEKGFVYYVGKNILDEGYFIIWENKGKSVGTLDYTTYDKIVAEAKKAKLKTPYHVYARYEVYQDKKNVMFYKIPDKILAHLGLNENSERFNEELEGEV